MLSNLETISRKVADAILSLDEGLRTVAARGL